MSREVLKGLELASNIERFDSAWDFVRAEANEQNGWISTPIRDVVIAQKSTQVRLFAFVPTELSYEFGSKYFPSVYAEIGERTYLEDGTPVGELDRRYVRRNDLGSNDLNMQKVAEAQLARVEEAVIVYQHYL